MNEYTKERNEKGFTLIELLIAIVVVGILAAVAIVGIGGLTTTGGKSACTASADAATTASAAFYANNAQVWPTTIGQMSTVSTTGPVNSPAVYALPAGAPPNPGLTMTVGTWTMTMTPATATAGPSFGC
jgi:prepilin-type N-terminal cleavage/methylation domain-containing protein